MSSRGQPVDGEPVVNVHEIDYGNAGPPNEGEGGLLEELNQAADTPAEDIMVTTSLRLPVRLHRQLREFATSHNTSPSDLMRAWIEVHTAEEDRVIALSDALRALATLRSAA